MTSVAPMALVALPSKALEAAPVWRMVDAGGRVTGRRGGVAKTAAALLFVLHAVSFRVQAAAPPTSEPAGSASAVRAARGTLRSVEKSLQRGEFETAVEQLRELNQNRALPNTLRAESYYLLGWAYLYLGDGASARAAYQRLNHLQPDFRVPRAASPRLELLLDQAIADNRPSGVGRGSSEILASGVRPQLSSVSFSRFTPLARAPRYRGPQPGLAGPPPERSAAATPAASNIVGWTHWIK